MSTLTLPQPDFMQDEELRMFADAAQRFFSRAAPPERIQKWVGDGQVEREFWTEVGEAGFLGVSLPEENMVVPAAISGTISSCARRARGWASTALPSRCTM